MPRKLLSRTVWALLASSSALAQPAQAAPKDFGTLSLEELMNEPITSVAKRLMRLGDAAAAVSVITPEDIRRSGVTTLADALRLAPGMHVARANSHAWAISARGFQGVFAEKLLVMIDGRTIYEPMFAGVHWGIQDLVLEDVERIEVVRGPGATLWGANAVNGVVNIITRSAAETHGTLVSSSVSAEDRPSLTLRHGGATRSAVNYRVYAKYFDREGLLTAAGNHADDDWSALRTGFRLDWQADDSDAYMLQGDVFHGRVTENVTQPLTAPPFTTTSLIGDDEAGGNVLGRWTRTLSDSSQLTVQSFYSHSQFRIAGGDVRADTFDVDMQHQFDATARQTIVWGTGYRLIDDGRDATSQTSVTPDHRTMRLYSGFVQDEISLLPDRLRLTMGLKLEHNYQTGFETQPGVRLAWTPGNKRTLWASVSRAVRTPDRFESGGRTAVSAFRAGPAAPLTQVSLVGNPRLQSEELLAYEIGYRFEPTHRIAVSLATFYNEYDHVIDFVVPTVAFVPTGRPPHLAISKNAANALGGSSYGAEVSFLWTATDLLHVTADYTWLQIPFLDGSHEFDSPEHLAHLRGHWTLPRQVELTGALSYTDRLHNKRLDAYLQLDLGVIWHPTDSLEIGLWGQNLLDERQQEFTDLHTTVTTAVARSAMLRATRRF